MQSIHHSILDTVLSFLCFPSLNSFIYVSVYRSMIPKYISCPNLSSEFQIQMGPCLDDISPWISQRHHKSTCTKQNMSSDSTCSSAVFKNSTFYYLARNLWAALNTYIAFMSVFKFIANCHQFYLLHVSLISSLFLISAARIPDSMISLNILWLPCYLSSFF